jgi:hypothetical protein
MSSKYNYKFGDFDATKMWYNISRYIQKKVAFGNKPLTDVSANTTDAIFRNAMFAETLKTPLLGLFPKAEFIP